MVAPIIPDESTQVAALRTGAIDLLSLLPTRYRVTLLDTSPDLQRRSQVAGNSWQIAYKHEEGQLLPVEPFTDIRVRKAMSMAIDRQGIIDSLFLGVGDVLTYPISPAAGPMYTPVEELPDEIQEFFEYDPEKAKQLLADAGHPDGFKTELWTVAPVDDIYQAVAGYWAAVGIEAELVPIERGAIGALYSSKDFPQMLSASGGSTVNPLSDMESFVNVGANLNVANYNDPWLNDKMQAALRTDDIEEWTSIFDEMNLYYLEKWPAFGLPRPHLDYWWWPWLRNYYGEVDMSYFDSGIVGAIVWLGPK
jgi:peptide/nickel transport system substrate-binding protein